MGFAEELAAASGSGGDHNAKLASYSALVVSALKSADDAVALVRHLADEGTPLVISRPTLQEFAEAVGGALSASERQGVLEKSLELLEGRAVAFEEPVSLLLTSLAAILQADERWREAAAVLKRVPLDSGQRVLSASYKMGIYVNIAQLYLEDKDSVEAETFMNRASDMLHAVREVQRRAAAANDDKGDRDARLLLLKFNVCFAKILDAKREFMKAALRFNELSQVQELIDDKYRTKSLLMACRNAILAPAGPQKSRMLSTLYKDERTQQLSTVYPILEAMFLERVLRPQIVDPFVETLKPHHKALLADGQTVPQRAVVEHNIMAAANLYKNITFAELGALLGLDAAKAEKTVIKMVQEERLTATIDQVNSLIQFEHDTGTLGTWDQNIGTSCHAVNDICATLLATPKYAAIIGTD